VSGYPRISVGIGELSPEMWDRLMLVMRFVENIIGDSDESEEGSLGRVNPPKTTFIATITGSSEIGANRYKYEWLEVNVELDSGDLTETIPVGLALGHDAVGYAYNLCELSNTDTSVGSGVHVGEELDYPTGFSMMPIGKCGDDTEIDVGVVMTLIRGSKGEVIPVFSMVNAHDGECDE